MFMDQFMPEYLKIQHRIWIFPAFFCNNSKFLSGKKTKRDWFIFFFLLSKIKRQNTKNSAKWERFVIWNSFFGAKTSWYSTLSLPIKFQDIFVAKLEVFLRSLKWHAAKWTFFVSSCSVSQIIFFQIFQIQNSWNVMIIFAQIWHKKIKFTFNF